MELVRLEVHRHYNGKYYLGEVEFTGEHGGVKLHLNDAFSRSVFQLCGDALVETAQATAEKMTATIIDAQNPLLEGPGEDDD